MVETEESQVIPADREAPLNQWAEQVTDRFGQEAEKQIFLFSYGRKLEAKPGGEKLRARSGSSAEAKGSAEEVSFAELGVGAGEEFLLIAQNQRRTTFRCRVN